MTNEQAKKMIKAKLECLKRETSGTDFDCNNRNCDECSLCYEQGNMGEQKEALDMAIKALEQQPCEDTISRQAAIDEIKEIYEWHDNVTKERIIEHFKQLPSAQPEIIRCKDCKHYNGENRDICCPLADYAQSKCGADWFCADGERKEAEHEK